MARPVVRGEYAGRGRPVEAERERLGHLARRLNPGTRRRMRDLGIGPGWRCVEVGAGEGSMCEWMAEQVGPSGRVVAADIDTHFLTPLSRPNLEVRTLDLRSDDLEPDHFQLAYCRTLLLHLPDPEQALRKLVAALAPGGWLLVQDPDVGPTGAADLDHPDAEAFGALIHRVFGWLRSEGVFDPYFGRRLPRMLSGLGLSERGSEGTAVVVPGGSEEMEIYRQTFDALVPMLRSKSVLSADEVALLQRLYADPGFDQITDVQVAAWGRKPA